MVKYQNTCRQIDKTASVEYLLGSPATFLLQTGALVSIFYPIFRWQNTRQQHEPKSRLR